ncbi:MAG: 50S ribosomal protein L11 methyltransferase [Povalibacter sp.]
MPFLQVTLAIGSADPEAYEDALFAAGALSVTLEDAADHPVLEPAPGTTPLWPNVQIKALFDGAADPDVVQAVLRSQPLPAMPDPNFQLIEDRVWEREWLKDFHPMRFGKRLWICPDGQRPTDDELHTQGFNIEPCFIDLDPGLAFGTGTHPTTALCLEWLDGVELSGRTTIDYGCGSGILAIAALKLGAAAALAVDIDPQALVATQENATRNGVDTHLTVRSVSEMTSAPAHLLLANILAEPLIELAPKLAALVEPEGRIVLSGILHEQASQVASRYAAWFDIAPITVRDGWARIDGIRNKDTC